jgi:hypothetical protein
LTLLVDALVVVGGLWVGRRVMRKALARARSRSRRRIGPEEPIESVDVFTAFPCRLGDVLVRRVERDEAWLAGALVLSEDRPVAALFIAPEAVQDRAVYARAARSEVAWLAPMATGALAPRGEPPSAIEIERVRFERTRRLPVRVQRLGAGAPEIGGRALIAEYSGPGVLRLVIVAGEGAVLAWRGVALSEREYDVLPAGAPTGPDET